MKKCGKAGRINDKEQINKSERVKKEGTVIRKVITRRDVNNKGMGQKAHKYEETG